MTAPNTSGTQSLINTIMMIRQLQAQDFAQQLQTQQQALDRQRLSIAQAAEANTEAATKSQIASTGEQMLGHLGVLASSLPDPKVLLPHVQDIANRTGLDAETIKTIFENAAPDVAATRNAAIARGVDASGGAIDVPSAYAALTGGGQGATSLDQLHSTIFQGVQGYLQKLPPDQRKLFNAGVLQKIGTGQTLGEALNDQIFATLPPEQQQQAIQIGKGLAPSASEVIQARLGAGQLALQTNAQEVDAAYKTIQGQAALMEAQARLKGAAQEQAVQLIKQLTDYQQFLSKNSSTFTPQGQVEVNGGYNALIDKLSAIDPQVAKNFVKIKDLTQPTSFPSVWDYIKAQK